MTVIISRRAEDDLASIFARIARERPSSADAFKAAAEASCRLLETHPEVGPRARFRTRHEGLRFWPVTDFPNYLIYYTVGSNEVSVERVLDGRRDVAHVFKRP